MELSTMFKSILQRGEEVLHRYIEGEKVDVDGSKIVDVDRRPDHCPSGTPAPPEVNGREPPSFFFLGLPLDVRRVSPLVLGLHDVGGAGAPPRSDLLLYSFLFRVPQIWPKTISYIPGDS